MINSWNDDQDFQRFIDAGGMVEPRDEMPEGYRHEVFRFIEFHANSELMGGLTERDWIPRAPGVRLKQIFLAKTQDEIGHAHLLYQVAADMGVKSRTEMLEQLFAGTSRFHNVFHYQAVTWADQIAIAYLVDAAAFASQRAVFAECSYGPYKRVLKRIVAEEGFHMRHGEEMLLRLAEGTRTQRSMFQAALDRWWWPAVQLFGPDSDPNDPLLAWKIKSQPNEQLRHAYIQKYVPLLQGYGFEIPDANLRFDEQAADGKGAWVTTDIDWEPLIATMRQGGPDSRRRIMTAAENYRDTAWVRAALETAATARVAS
ncbi:MAG: 1,2-phenylacetyl-CoA epoxidase subunit A [Acidimicrobiales bacterium]|nr:1,2-phenylacetyl-CoA epoxidase subunit A [Acidimicrobiales bacterium]